MKSILDFGVTRPRALPSFDPAGILLRLDAAYRARRRASEMTPDQLDDVGMTRADIERIFGRD